MFKANEADWVRIAYNIRHYLACLGLERDCDYWLGNFPLDYRGYTPVDWFNGLLPDKWSFNIRIEKGWIACTKNFTMAGFIGYAHLNGCLGLKLSAW